MRKVFVLAICFLSGMLPCLADFSEYIVPSGTKFFVKNCNEIDLKNVNEGERVDFVLGDDFIYGKFKVYSGAKANGTITGVKKGNTGETEIIVTEAISLNGDKIPVAGKIMLPKSAEGADIEETFPAGHNFEVILLRPVTVNPSVK